MAEHDRSAGNASAKRGVASPAGGRLGPTRALYIDLKHPYVIKAEPAQLLGGTYGDGRRAGLQSMINDQTAYRPLGSVTFVLGGSGQGQGVGTARDRDGHRATLKIGQQPPHGEPGLGDCGIHPRRMPR